MCNIVVTKRVWDDMAGEWQQVHVHTYVPEEIEKSNRAEHIIGSFVGEIAKGLTLALGIIAWSFIFFSFSVWFN